MRARELILRDRKGKELLVFVPDENSFCRRELMGEDSATLYFALNEYKEIPVGTYTEIYGTRYTLLEPAQFKTIHSQNHEYTLTMEAPSGLLKKIIIENLPSSREASFYRVAKPAEHLQIIIDNLKAKTGIEAWTIGKIGVIEWIKPIIGRRGDLERRPIATGVDKLIHYDFTTAWDALKSIAEEYGTEFEVDGYTINLHEVEYNHKNASDITVIGYGKGKGLLSGVARSNEEALPPEKLFIKGSNRNIEGAKYLNRLTLHFPRSTTVGYNGKEFTVEQGQSGYTYYKTNSTGSSMWVSGMLQPYVEGQCDCSDIYPSRIGTATSAFTNNVEKNWYDFSDSSIPASLNYERSIIPGQTLTVAFQTGNLAGREFEAKYKHERGNTVVRRGEKGAEIEEKTKVDRLFLLIPQEVDGIWLPNKDFKPAKGDQYVVLNVMLPNEYVRAAEYAALQVAIRQLWDANHKGTFSINAEVDPFWIQGLSREARDKKLRIGSHFHINDARFSDPSGFARPIRIGAIKRYLDDEARYEIEFVNKHVQSLLDKMKRQRDAEALASADFGRGWKQYEYGSWKKDLGWISDHISWINLDLGKSKDFIQKIDKEHKEFVVGYGSWKKQTEGRVTDALGSLAKHDAAILGKADKYQVDREFSKLSTANETLSAMVKKEVSQWYGQERPGFRSPKSAKSATEIKAVSTSEPYKSWRAQDPDYKPEDKVGDVYTVVAGDSGKPPAGVGETYRFVRLEDKYYWLLVGDTMASKITADLGKLTINVGDLSKSHTSLGVELVKYKEDNTKFVTRLDSKLAAESGKISTLETERIPAIERISFEAKKFSSEAAEVAKAAKSDALQAKSEAEASKEFAEASKNALDVAVLKIPTREKVIGDITSGLKLDREFHKLVKGDKGDKGDAASAFAFSLIRGGGKPFHRAENENTNYKVHSWLADDKLVEGDWYTVVAKIRFNPKVDRKSWAAFYLGGSSELWDAGEPNGHKRTEARDGVIVFHRKLTTATRELILYQGGNGWGSGPIEHRGCEIRVDWVCMYRGKHDSPPLEFVPHRLEIYGKDGKDGISPNPIDIAREFSTSDECRQELGKQLKPTKDVLDKISIWKGRVEGKVDKIDSIALDLGKKADSSAVDKLENVIGKPSADGAEPTGIFKWQATKEQELTLFVNALDKRSDDIIVPAEEKDTWGGKALLKLKNSKANSEATWVMADESAAPILKLPPAFKQPLDKTYIFDFSDRKTCHAAYGHIQVEAGEVIIDSLRNKIEVVRIQHYYIISAPMPSICSTGAIFEFRCINYCLPNSDTCRKAWLWVNYTDLSLHERIDNQKGSIAALRESIETAKNTSSKAIKRVEDSIKANTKAIQRVEGSATANTKAIQRVEESAAANTKAIKRVEDNVKALRNNVLEFNASHWDNAGWTIKEVPDIPNRTKKKEGSYAAKRTDGFLYVREKNGCKSWDITLPSDAAVGTVIYVRTADGIFCNLHAPSGGSVLGRKALNGAELAMCVCSGGKEWIISVTKLD